MTAHYKIFGLLGIMSLFMGAAFPVQWEKNILYNITEATAPGMEAGIKQQLSEYAFFTGPLANLQTASNVFPYEVNAPLFSDYAEKARFIYLPAGTKMQYSANASFDYPEGAVLIKNFYYWKNAAQPEQGRRIIETRLLLKDAKSWKALEYVWNMEQSDASLEVAGGVTPVSWQMANGKQQRIDYTIPNLNQCKGCHSYKGQFTPIGTTTKQLNMNLPGGENQLLLFQKRGILDLPEHFDPSQAAHLADYRKPGNTDAAARAYLDSNCAHCHNPHGPAGTSGMFLNVEENNPEHLGIGKPPVAAGRGSGKRKFGIVPGKPAESILLFRMEDNDPGIRMPEIGRQLMHEEGVALIKNWIREMK